MLELKYFLSVGVEDYSVNIKVSLRYVRLASCVIDCNTSLLVKVINGEIKLNADLMQQGNFIDVFLVRHVSGTYAHNQEH